MNEIPTEIVNAATSRPTLPKFAKGGFIPLEGHPVEPNCDEKDLIGPPELFVRIRDDKTCIMEERLVVSMSESIQTDLKRILQMRRSC